jgi:hypothetical protein
MDLTQLVGCDIIDQHGSFSGQVLGFHYFGGRLVLVARVETDDLDDYEDDPEDPDKEEIPEDEVIPLSLVGSKNA